MNPSTTSSTGKVASTLSVSYASGSISKKFLITKAFSPLI
jgi:hypothetical protein